MVGSMTPAVREVECRFEPYTDTRIASANHLGGATYKTWLLSPKLEPDSNILSRLLLILLPRHTKMSSQGLSGKTCLVTGGGGGLGKEISRQLLAKGANVVICDINKDLLDSASKEFSGQGTLLTIQCDITSMESAEAMFKEIIQKLGKLDVLINNAGIMDRFDPAGDLDKDLWDKVIAVNLTAPYVLTKLAVRHFLDRGATDASILNVGSLSSRGGFFAGRASTNSGCLTHRLTHHTGAAYTASKHGLLGLSKNTAAFYRDKGIRCNLIMPSGMNTNIATAFGQGTNQDGMTVAMASGQAVKAAVIPLEDVARLAVFFASDESSAISGSCVTVDKGFTSLY